MRMYRVRMPEAVGGQSLICPTTDSVITILIDECQAGDTIEVEVINMTVDEFNKLPEQEDW